jgi:hypothetical protein
MHSQLSYTATKLEIADRQRRAEHGLACARPPKSARPPRRTALVRLVILRRTPSAAAPAGTDAA